MDAPTTLQQAIIYFSDVDRCNEFMIDVRWPDGQVRCPHCDSPRVTYLANAKLWKCNVKHDRQKFSLKVGTIFEDSPLGLDKWLAAVWLIVNCKNGISSYEMARDLGVTQKSAWFMNHRIRLALHERLVRQQLSGEVEVDETFIGGKARNMHVAQRKRRITGTGGKDKTVVLGMLERGGKVRTKVVENRKKQTLQAEVHEHVEAGRRSTRTNCCRTRARRKYAHQVIDHAVAYVDGKIHTNGMENYWSLLKRGLAGHLRVSRTVPPVPLPGRTGVPLRQSSGRERLRPLQAGRLTGRREAFDLRKT